MQHRSMPMQTPSCAAGSAPKKKKGQERVFKVGDATVQSLAPDEWPWKCCGEIVRPMDSWFNGCTAEENRVPWPCEVVGYAPVFRHGNGNLQPIYLIEQVDDRGSYFPMRCGDVKRLLTAHARAVGMSCHGPRRDGDLCAAHRMLNVDAGRVACGFAPARRIAATNVSTHT